MVLEGYLVRMLESLHYKIIFVYVFVEMDSLVHTAKPIQDKQQPAPLDSTTNHARTVVTQLELKVTVLVFVKADFLEPTVRPLQLPELVLPIIMEPVINHV